MTSGIDEDILGYRVWCQDGRTCVDAILDWVRTGTEPRWLACLNPHSFVVAERTPPFANALRAADWLIPDGVGIVLASRVLRGGIRERITGADIFTGLLARMEGSGGGRVFFLGSSTETLARIAERMRHDYRLVEVVGTYSPPFKDEYSEAEIAEMISAVNRAAPDVLWVGMTAPKQEMWIERVVGRLDVRFVAAVGAVFDFYSGRVKRSPQQFQRLGLEWLPRLLREPRRLWRRMLVSAPIFAYRVLRHRYGVGVRLAQ